MTVFTNSQPGNGAYTVSLPVFEGPLDLLLQLIERAELDITTVALARVADQYLAHVRSMAAPDPQALADFVAMAARLLLIKSRALLPRPAGGTPEAAADAEGDGEALARQLREYQQFRQAARLLREWQDSERRMFLRLAATEVPPPPPPARLEHSIADLIRALERRMQLQLPLEDNAPLALQPRLTVADVSQQIVDRLARQRWFSFEDLLATASSRQELVVTLWAVLELLKRRMIIVDQPALFGPIGIGRP
jgi:segregation and condensation protein A